MFLYWVPVEAPQFLDEEWPSNVAGGISQYNWKGMLQVYLPHVDAKWAMFEAHHLQIFCC